MMVAVCADGGCGRLVLARGLCRLHYERLRRAGIVRRVPPEDRVWDYIERMPNGCWLWTASTSRSGYGKFKAGGRNYRAHRFVWEMLNGPIPAGMTLDHGCHNRDEACNDGPSCLHRRCVNPAHLELATSRDNTMRGRTPAALNAAKTHCSEGHEFTPENTYTKPSGSRRCRTCDRVADAARQRAKRARQRAERNAA